ncbi:MAG: peptidylprolyl isomerase [Candidatus Hodarchaeota archaeon]
MLKALKEKKADNKIVEIGNIVEIEYIGALDDGTVFNRSEENKLLRFKVGAGEVIKGLENAVIGMRIGQKKEVEISPQAAYGGYNPNKVKKILKGPKERDLKTNTIIDVKLKDGRIILATVLEVTSSHVLLDFNHPLAGKKLFFSINLLDIK